MTVNVLWIELSLCVDEAQRHTAAAGSAQRDRPVEAALAPGMTGGVLALLLDLQPERVLVSVDAHLHHALGVAALLALAPQLAARARPVMRFARLDGAGESLGVHVGEHEHLAGRGRGRDHGQETVGVEARREDRSLLAFGLARRGREDAGLAHR